MQKVNGPADIHTQIVAVYGDIMNWQNVMQWCHEFSIHDKQRSGRPSLISDDLLQKTEGEIHANQHGAMSCITLFLKCLRPQ
jgi:hypothetical protein